MAAHAQTTTTAGYIRNAEGSRIHRSKPVGAKKRGVKSMKEDLKKFLESLPKIEVPAHSAEAFQMMRKVAQKHQKSFGKQDIVRRTDNASEDIAANPFRKPKNWSIKWSFHRSSDRKRHKIGSQAQTWGFYKKRNRGSLVLSNLYHVFPVFMPAISLALPTNL